MLEQVAYLAEILGAIGVVFSLIYVGRQIQQTNIMSRSALQQSMSGQMNEWAMGVATSTELADALSKVHLGNLVREDASDRERIQIAYALLGVLSQIHLAWEQQKDGILTGKELDDLHGFNSDLMQRPYIRSAWPALRATFPADFSEWFERKCGLDRDQD